MLCGAGKHPIVPVDRAGRQAFKQLAFSQANKDARVLPFSCVTVKRGEFWAEREDRQKKRSGRPFRSGPA